MKYFVLLSVLLIGLAGHAAGFSFYKYTCEYSPQGGRWISQGGMSWSYQPNQLGEGQTMLLDFNGESSSDGARHFVSCESLSGASEGVMVTIMFAPLNFDDAKIDGSCRILGTNSVTVSQKVLTTPDQTFAASYDAGFDQQMQLVGFLTHAPTADDVLAACLAGAELQSQLNPPRVK